MEEIYSTPESKCKLVKTRKHKIDALLAFSKSLHIVKLKGKSFENNLN